jgi:transcriptional regulator with XRE-family HTH domain
VVTTDGPIPAGPIEPGATAAVALCEHVDGLRINAKTIARIERGEVEKPHGETLAKISDVLGVEPDEIDTY